MIYIYTEIRTGFHQNPLPSGNVLTSKASFADFLMMLNAALISAPLHLPKAGPVPDPDQPFPWIHVDQITKLVHILKPALYYLKYIDLRFLILDLYLNPSAHDHLPVLPNPQSPLSVYPRSSNDFT